MSERVLIVGDGELWYVRRVATTEHDMDQDEVVYTCDEPIANDLTLDEAVQAAKDFLNG